MNEQTFKVGDYVETNTGDRGTILSIDLHLTTGLYTAYLDHDGGTKGSWLVRDLTKVSHVHSWRFSLPAGNWQCACGQAMGKGGVTEDNSPIEAWREAVANGITTLGLDAWMTEQMAEDEDEEDEDTYEYQFTLSANFTAHDEDEAWYAFKDWLTDPHNVEDGTEVVELPALDPDAKATVKVFGPDGLLAMGGSNPTRIGWVPGDED